MKRSKLLLFVFLLTLLASSLMAAGLEKFQFLKISAQEQKAVMKTPEGELQLVGVGDVIADEAEIVEVAEGRIVLERPREGGIETVIVRLDGNKQRIELIQPRGEKPPVLTAPENVKKEGENRKPGY